MQRALLFFLFISIVTLSGPARHLLIIIILLAGGVEVSIAQTSFVKKEYTAVRIASPPTIDGHLDDSCWINVAVATDFTQTEPNPGLPSRQRTEVKFVYDNHAVYIGAMMYDTHPDSMLCELSKRESVFFGPNCEAFGVVIDTYKDGLNGSFLGVSLAGVQTDTRIADPDEFDDSWNAVWESKVSMNKNGWIAEIRIPYSALRFPKSQIQEWGINFARMTRRYAEMSHWSPINVKEQGFIHQNGNLKGISNIESPLRLSLYPYVSAYIDNYNGSNTYSINGGADIKYGINESFTMDMTLIPDFGQVKSDDKVLNLSPFETYYDEKRQFFTEGTELFNRADLFYSRRIGGEPLGYGNAYDGLDSNEVVEKNPSTAQLYNATKISGRTKGKLGIGFFNAITAPANALILDTLSKNERFVNTQPLTNYNVVVLDQRLKNNSFISLINTNVMREGSTYDANVTGTHFKLSDKNNKFAFAGDGALSQIFHPDSSASLMGYKYRVTLAKTSGNYLVDLSQMYIGKTFDPNDMGYLDRNNELVYFLNQNYNIYEPFWKINRMNNNLGIAYFMRADPQTYTRLNVGWNTQVVFKNNFSWDINIRSEPLGLYDYYEPRVEGRYYLRAPFYGMGTFFSTDDRKRFGLEGNIGRGVIMERARENVEWSLTPRYRFSDKFNMNYTYFSSSQNNSVGWVNNINDTIIFGVRDIDTKENSIEGNYLFSSTMSLSLFLRHYWSQVKYVEYFELNEEGGSSATSYTANHDINFNAFNIDLSFTWHFLPGSEMSVVWKNAILTADQALLTDYFDDLDRTVSSPQQNSFSIRVLYYMDYQSMKKR